MTKKQPQKREKRRPGRKLGVKVKHGAYSLIARGTLPQKRRYIEAFLTEVRRGLIMDLGPKEENMTTAQRILLDRVIGKLGVLRCCEEFSRENGILQGGELLPILKQNYLSWANSLRLDLQALGIERRAVEPEMSLGQIIAEHDAKANQGDGDPGPGQGSSSANPGEGQAEGLEEGQGNEYD